MALFEIENLSFTYPEKDRKALKNISLIIDRGEFISICGRSGSGKSTLLRHLKPSLTPYGKKEGEISYSSKRIEDIDGEEDLKIGYVFQNPDNQIVTDKVWHELAFALENIGMDTGTIRLRVGEMASFFGIESWFYRNTGDLSGGQKQILNLASTMVMDPDILILDEPTSQLDPISTRDFLDMLKRINDDIGTTILISEHRLEDVLPISERLLALDEGELIYDGGIRQAGHVLKDREIFLSFPSSMQIYKGLKGEGAMPINVREAREFIEEFQPRDLLEDEILEKNKPIISIRECFFRYERKGRDIVRDLNLEIEEASIHSILGANGSGKSTSLLLLSNILKPYRGSIKIDGKRLNKSSKKMVMLPQDPQLTFVGKTVAEELDSVRMEAGELRELLSFMELEDLMDYHPYDLSGGEQQKLAFLKAVAKKPDILLLDEVTKGLDGGFKEKLGGYLRELKKEGMTIVMVSHDIEFCAKFSDRASLFFDGGIISSNRTRDFFSGNNFYTTKANRIIRDYNKRAITVEDVIKICQS